MRVWTWAFLWLAGDVLEAGDAHRRASFPRVFDSGRRQRRYAALADASSGSVASLGSRRETTFDTPSLPIETP